MEKNMTRQFGSLVAALGEIVDFLGDLDNLPTGFDICDAFEEADEAADFLRVLAEVIDDFLPDGNVGDDANFGFFAQIQRLICLLELLADNLDRIDTTICPISPRCIDIANELLCAIIEALAILVGILVKLIVLDSDLVDAGDIDIFDCLVCSLVKEITAFEEAVKDISRLIRKLFICNLDDIEDNNCTDCGVATHSVKRPKAKVHVNNNTCGCKK